MVKKSVGTKQAKPSVIKANKLTASKEEYFFNGGSMGALMRDFDWASTSLGNPEKWPPYLLYTANNMLNADIAMCIWWNKKQLFPFYNDRFYELLADNNPLTPGRSFSKASTDNWRQIKKATDSIFKNAQPITVENIHFIYNKHDKKEDKYISFSLSPLFDFTGDVEGVSCLATDVTDNKQTRQRLRETEERFQAIADTAPMYIAMADELGNAVYFNKPWLEFTGMSMQKMLGDGWVSTLHPEDIPKFEKDFEKAFVKKLKVHTEYRFKRADGEYRWMLAVGAPRFTLDGRFVGYFATYTDFHDLKETQLALKASEKRFRTLIEKSADAIQLVSPEGKIIFTSDSIKNVLGYTAQELQDETVKPFIHPKDSEYFYSNFNEILKQPGKQLVMQYRVKHKNGAWAWLETVAVNHIDTPHIHAIVGNFRNITKQKQIEARVKRSEKRFRALVDNIPNLAWMAHADGSIYWYNNRWYEYTGTTPESMEGWGWQSVHDPEVLPIVLKEWNHSIASGEVFEMVFPIKGIDGQFRPFLTRVVPVRNDNGEVEQWIGTNTDISEQLNIQKAKARNKELELIAKQLSIQQNELIEINKAKDEFISLASHQLRTPATGVKQYVGMMLSGYAGELSKDQQEFAKHAYESNERQIMIIDDLLKVAQVDAGHMQIMKQNTNLTTLIEDVLNEQAEKFKDRNQKIKFRHDAEPVFAEVDIARMRMVLDNLVDNAGKYTPKNKQITLSIGLENEIIRIDIKDQGVGIPKSDRERIFEKFVRLDNSLSMVVGGSGLGLYLADKIVKLHGGTIDITSTVSKGTTFIVKLPKPST